jgi:predicted O-methyltransferase YrrM
MKYINPDIESSFQKNDLGRTLYDLVLEKKPKKIVEWGVLYGYSTVAMAMALDELGEGHITGYDLFEDYAFKHSTLEQTQANIDRYGVSKYVTLAKGDFKEWIKNPEPFDLLHVDISNHGDTVTQLYEGIKDRVKAGAIVIFEGGATGEREEILWMKKYSFPKISDSGVPYKVIDERFPSISQIIA